jgi:Cu(I)-responsive transcriptional regulator
MAGKSMTIGEASAASGVSAKMIRYYETVSLLAPAGRTAAGYRQYDETEVQTLRFLKRARSLGFSVTQMRELLALWRDERRSKAEVQKLALSHAAELEAKARAIAEMSAALRHLAHQCATSDRPGCPIIEELAEAAPDAGQPSRRQTTMVS